MDAKLKGGAQGTRRKREIAGSHVHESTVKGRRDSGECLEDSSPIRTRGIKGLAAFR